VEFVIGLGMRVLHGNLRTEVHVWTDRFTEFLVVGEVGRIHRGHIELHESLSLLFSDLEVSVHIDQVGESEFSAEAVRTTEWLGGEGGQVIDVLGLARSEEGLEQRIFEDAALERVLKAMQHSSPPANS
jgi:hypothetical protein